MAFDYHWDNSEANFGPPLADEVAGGTHITIEILLKYKGNFVALRRPLAIPGHEKPEKAGQFPSGCLYFCHNLIRKHESFEDCVRRIVREQAGVEIESYRVINIDSMVQDKDGQWAFMPYVLAELSALPVLGVCGNEVTEVVSFDHDHIPDEFGWWTKEELSNFFQKEGLDISWYGISTKVIVLNKEGKLLTMLRGATAPARPLTWDLPGGDVDHGDNILETALREVKEEAGIEVASLTFLDTTTSPSHISGNFWLTIAYVAHVENPEVKISWEHDEYRWVTKDEFLALKSSQKLRRFVEKLA